MPHFEARNGESDQVLHVEFVVILLVVPDAEFEAEQLLRPAFGVEVGECGHGARGSAAFETFAPERHFEGVDGDQQRGVGVEIRGEIGVK